MNIEQELKELETLWRVMTDKPLDELPLTLYALLMSGAARISFMGKVYTWRALKDIWEYSSSRREAAKVNG